MNFQTDPAYLQLLDTNRELRKELGKEVDINQTNEKKIRVLIKELEQCSRTISFQDTTIITYEKEVQELKSQVSDLQKRLRLALKDDDKKESYVLDLEQRLSTLEEEVVILKKKIRKLTSKKYNRLAMSDPIQPPRTNELNNIFETVQDECRDIDEHFRGSQSSQLNQRDILTKLNIITSSANRLKEIAYWENDEAQTQYQQYGQVIAGLNNQATQLQAQIQGDAQIIIQLQAQLDTANNNFDLLNQAHIFQTGQLQTCQTDLQNWRRKHAKRKGKHIKQKAKHKKWENKEKGSRQIIINLNQQILALQNNPPNMATPIGDLTGIAPLLANVEFYNGQVQPDEWYNGINAILSYPAVTQIDDAHKVAILKSKLGKKYADVPNQHAGNNIDTPARLYEWLCYKYQIETVGTQQVALQRLAYEKFLPNDTPETYETRIRPLLLGVANDDANALSFLMNHLPDDLFNLLVSANPANINAFFTDLKKLWLKRRPSSFNYGNANSMNGMAFQPPQQIVQQPAFQPPQQIVQQPVFQPPQQIVQPTFQPPQQIVQQPTFQRNFRTKTEKAKYYEDLKNYADMGLDIEDNRVFEPMEIDYAIINLANKLDQPEGLLSSPNQSINVVRTPRVNTRPFQRKCEICKKLGHTYRSCPIIKNMMVNNSRKRTGHVNFADGFQQSHSDTEEIPNESTFSDQEGDDGIDDNVPDE